MIGRCRDPEGWRLFSILREFDFTLCFEEGVILPSFLAVFLACTLTRLCVISKLDKSERSKLSTWLLRIKLFVLACVLSASLLSLAGVVGTPSNSALSIPYWYTLEVIYVLVSIPFTYFNHTRSRTSSTIQLLFWPVYIILLLIWGRTSVTARDDPSASITSRTVVGSLGTLFFILECVGPEIGLEKIKENPVMSANIFSIWTFEWMTPLLKKGSSHFITEDDLPPLPPKDECAKLGKTLQEAMRKQKRLWLALFKAYGRTYAVAAILKLVQDCLSFLQPQLLRLLLAYISSYQEGRKLHSGNGNILEGLTIAVIMFVAAMAQTVILHQYFQRCFTTGMRVRAGLINALYNKALVLSSDERNRSSGDIINLMSVDTTRLQDFCTYGLIAISGPFQIFLAFVSLYQLLGWPAFVGVAIMVVSVPLNAYIARILKKMQESQMKTRDKRTKMMSELLNNIKSIKLYAWENAFLRRILEVRNNQELKNLRKIGIANSLNTALWSGIPLLVAFSSFAVAAITSPVPLTSDIIFPSISLFMLLQFPLAMFAQVTSNIAEAIVSIKRLQSFFDADELQEASRYICNYPNSGSQDEPILSIKNGEFKWTREASVSTLEDINLTVRKGELVGVLGRVGAGKSSLLSAIIGDMRRVDGELHVNGTISYAPQNPWIMSASVRDNILFAHQYEEDFYNRVLDACALRQDLALLPQGDMTEVGEKGITLSGGQKARISLARAVYARADLILLDDVLAAVDSHVAKHVFNQVIGPNGILSTKARILVTNSIHFLKYFNYIMFIRHGIVVEAGTYEQLNSQQGGYIASLIKGHGNILTSSGTSTPKTTGTTASDEKTDSGTLSEEKSNNKEDESLSSKCASRRTSFSKPVVTGISLTPASRTTKEHSEQGRVKIDVYLRYIQAASVPGFIILLLAIVLQQGVQILGNVVLKAWGEHNRETGSNSDMGKYLLAYGLSSLSATLLGAASAILMWVLIALRSARSLHDSMLQSVLRAPLSFFEMTPMGRILNLFSRDTYVVDQVLARIMLVMIRTLLTCAGIIAVIGASFPLFLISVIPLGWIYRKVMLYYLATSRELKRLDAVSRSPIFAWFSESLNGLSTIRAFNLQQIFIHQNEYRVDRNQMCYLPSISINRWLAIRLEFVGAVIILIASVLALVALMTTGVDAGLVGLVLSYGLNTTSSLNWVVRSASEVEQNVVSVERILHYIKLDPEAPYEKPESKPEEHWPEEGGIEFRNYSMRYRPDLDLCLKNISIKIKGKEKIGICGRTGAGKSSLLLALFRIIEPASGTILIDGIDVTNLGLYDLRSAISIVPQSPDMFEGTIRENIDPAGEYQDADIWVALDQAHLKHYIESLPGGLDAPVHEGGSSMSQGQRQLVCFARALLRRSRILVLDEATSAVDLETDQAIQEIIRGPQFTDVTMLIIAHRINTILDSDRVLVLGEGEVKEFDTPQNLLSRKDSVFRSLAEEAGLA